MEAIKSIINNFFNSIILFQEYFRTIDYIGYINSVLRYIPIILIIVGLILVMIAIKMNAIKKRTLKKNRGLNLNLELFSIAIRENKLTSILIGSLSDSLCYSNGLKPYINDILTVLIEIAYFIIGISAYEYSSKFSPIWYTKVVNFATSFLLPLVIYSVIQSFMTNKVLKQLPAALKEIAAAYRSCLRVVESIRMAIPYMPKEIQKEFIRAYDYFKSDKTFDDGLLYLQRRIKDPYIVLLCKILELGKTKNNDIADRLDFISVDIQDKMLEKADRRRDSIFIRMFYIAILMAVPFAMDFIAFLSQDAYEYYFTLEGSFLLTAILVAIIVGYTMQYIFEKTT